ncbi:MAG: hypothetical protein JO235_25270 [Chroococcidiopsidaceae cyanobacterium CP_BM_RX_35]|nr:hypothetical protein [Chroococcidiopsidaceae cyanobacterium CP_BM_RX_35]
MKSGNNFDTEQWQSELQAVATIVRTLAQGKQGDSLALLALLRKLEELHREIRDGIFQASLPDNRQALYTMLKDIQSEGGWPYIQHMKLEAFFTNLSIGVEAEADDFANAKSEAE